MKLYCALLIALGWVFSFQSAMSTGKEKKTMDHTVYDQWKSLENDKISNDGSWISYEINPQVGDGYAYLFNVITGQLDSVPRGASTTFDAQSTFWASKIVAYTDTLRQLKLNKVKKDKFPKDSLLVRNLSTGEEVSFALVDEYKVARDGGNYIAIKFDKAAIPKDTTKTKSKDKKKKKFSSKGTPLVFYRPLNGDSIYVEKVTHYSLSENGKSAYAVQSLGDTAEVSVLLKLNVKKWELDTVTRMEGNVAKLTTAWMGDQCAFLFSNDTVDKKTYRLYHLADKQDPPQVLVDTMHASLPENWCALTKGPLYFSKNGERLFFGAGRRPQEEPKDTLTDDEKYHVDIWNWQDKEIQPMQKKNLSKAKDRAFLCTYNFNNNKLVQLESEEIERVSIQQKGDLVYALGYNSQPYMRASSWTGLRSSDVYLLDVTTGSKKLLKKNQSKSSSLSFNGDWFVYYEPADSNFYSINTSSDKVHNLTASLSVLFCNELHDTPNDPYPYGMMGWTKDGKNILVYDRFDIWQLSLDNKKEPWCLTKGKGREKQISLRYIKLDPDEKYIDLKQAQLLRGFNEQDKSSGYYQLNKAGLNQLKWGDFAVYTPKKARDAETLTWRKSTFTKYPELQVSDLTFKTSKIISITNPQQSEYKWGQTQLVDWIASDGLKHQGILVTPENMDPNKKYPMVLYFYDRRSDRLHSYISPRPSRSTVNWSFYASNDYIIFVPDIFYRTGDPGLCAYEAIVSGTLAMADRFPFIDLKNVALQGQSWGGYQTTHLITRTNLYKAAMAGAPVSNMTSAYGGIRWGTGMSRMFQYEHTQSRIGGTLWEKTNKYIENSPLFFAPQVETPLLMMHNDNDGAVPWYQGIEFFMALRRLDKPVWMLVYNNEEHNLTQRANRKDLSRRMMQFFDHYLKGKPMPVWMKEGIPAVDKGEKSGYEYVE